MNPSTIYARVNLWGWDAERALTTPGTRNKRAA